MVFAKTLSDGSIATKVLREVSNNRLDQRLLTKRLLQTIAGRGSDEEIAAMRERRQVLSSSNSLANELATPKTPSQQLVDVLFRTKNSTGTWASAIKFLKHNIMDTGIELTTDHASRIVALWTAEKADKPPLKLLLQWWTLLSIERPPGFDTPSRNLDGTSSPPAALRYLPTVAAAVAESRHPQLAMQLIEKEVAIVGGKCDLSSVRKAKDNVAWSLVDPGLAVEEKAIQSCLSVVGKQEDDASSTPIILPLLAQVSYTKGLSDDKCPTFSVVFDTKSGTLTKQSTDGKRSFDGIAMAIVATHPTPAEGVRLCESFIHSSSANAVAVLNELKLRYLFATDAAAGCRYLDSIKPEQRTPFMVVPCLRYFADIGRYDSAVNFARYISDTWGPNCLPCSVMNRLCAMRSEDKHSDAFWLLVDRCRHRITSKVGVSLCSSRPVLSSQFKMVSVEEILSSLSDLVATDKLNGARMVIERLPSVSLGRCATSEDAMMLQTLISVGGDWQLALEILKQQQ